MNGKLLRKTIQQLLLIFSTLKKKKYTLLIFQKFCTSLRKHAAHVTNF